MSPRRQLDRDEDREEDDNNPLKLSPDKKVSLPFVMLISLVGISITATVGWMALQAEVRAVTVTVNAANTTANQHEERLRALEKSQTQIAEALSWIRQRMEEERRPGRE